MNAPGVTVVCIHRVPADIALQFMKGILTRTRRAANLANVRYGVFEVDARNRPGLLTTTKTLP
jgi:hypothetical protein